MRQVQGLVSGVIWQIVQWLTLLSLHAISLSLPEGLSMNMTAMPNAPVTATLPTLPAEIRHKIFYHLMDEDPVKAVGYRSYDRDAFWIKHRGMVLIEAHIG